MDYLSDGVDEPEHEALGLGLQGVLELVDLLFLLEGEGQGGHNEKSDESYFH